MGSAVSGASRVHTVFVQQGANDFEWHVKRDGQPVATLPSQEQASGFAKGYTLGLRHGQETAS